MKRNPFHGVKVLAMALCAVAVISMSPVGAQAVAVKRVDSFIEIAMHSFEMELKAWFMNTAMSVLKVNSIQDLINLPSRLANIFKNFDAKSLLSDFAGDLLDGAMGDLSKEIDKSLKDLKIDLDIDFDLKNIANIPGALSEKFQEALGDKISESLKDLKVDLGLFDQITDPKKIEEAKKNFTKNVDGIIKEKFVEVKPNEPGYVAGTKKYMSIEDAKKTTYYADPTNPKNPADPYDEDGEDKTTQKLINDANAALQRPTYTRGEIEGMVKKSAENTATYMEEITQTVPSSIPAVQKKIVETSIENVPNEILQGAYFIEEMNKSKWTLLTKIGQISAKYADKKDSSYRNVANSIMEKNNEIIANAMQISKSGKGDALPAIAGLTAVQVQQLNLQNNILIEIEDILADQIRILSTIGMMDAENYSTKLTENMGRYYDIYRRAGSTQKEK